jgi:predicted nuclease of predicted toxin-antitoxin system
VKFILDAQLSPRPVKAITRAGHDATHVVDCGLLKSKDREIWRYAAENGYAIVTKDEDFAALRQRASTGPAVVWLRLGNMSNSSLQKNLLSVLPEIAAALEAGEALIEVR